MVYKTISVAAIFLFLISCNNNSSPDYDNSLPSIKVNNIPPPEPIMFKVDSVFPHDPAAFTQGWKFIKGTFMREQGNITHQMFVSLILKQGKQKRIIIFLTVRFLEKASPFLKIKSTSLPGKVTKYLFIMLPISAIR